MIYIFISFKLKLDEYIYEKGSLENGKYVASIHMKRLPELFIGIKTNRFVRVLTYDISGKQKTIVLTKSERENENGLYRVYPFASSKLKLILSYIVKILINNIKKKCLKLKVRKRKIK